jgi:hypothetical protein
MSGMLTAMLLKLLVNIRHFSNVILEGFLLEIRSRQTEISGNV